MLLAYFPFHVLDASLHMLEVPKEPVVILMEDEPQEAALAA